MAITKESKKILKDRLFQINTTINLVDVDLAKLIPQRDTLNTKIDELRAQKLVLQAEKSSIQTDTGA